MDARQWNWPLDSIRSDPDDLQMPVMGGLEATQKIRQYEKPPQANTLRSLRWTAHAMKGDREKCFEAGMDGYVSNRFKRIC